MKVKKGNFTKRLDFEQAAPGDVLSKSRKHEGNLSWIYFQVDFVHAIHFCRAILHSRDPSFVLLCHPSTDPIFLSFVIFWIK